MSVLKLLVAFSFIALFIGCSTKNIKKPLVETKQPVNPIESPQKLKNKQKKINQNNVKKQTTPNQVNLAQFNHDFLGDWFVFESTASFKIYLNKNNIKMSGKDVLDSEKFIISNLKWNGKSITGLMIMPSTNSKNQFILSMIDNNTIECTFKSKINRGLIWKRKSSLMKKN